MVTDFIFLGSKSLRMLAPWKESYDKPRQHFQKQRHHFADNGPHSQSYGFFRCKSWTLRRLRAKELMFSNCGVGEDS